MFTVLVVVLFVTSLLFYFAIEPLFISPLSKIPGPKTYALTKWRLAFDEWNGERTRSIERIHRQYGPMVRIGPNEVHVNSLSALRTVYGVGSAYERTEFYRIFEAYGEQNMFTFRSGKQHADRRKLLANVYSKSAVLKPPFAPIVEEKVKQYLDLIDSQESKGVELFTSLHYYALDNVTHVLYGRGFGATSATAGESSHRGLLGDIFDPARRQLIWFAIHFRTLTEWMYAQEGLVEKLLRPFLPMQKPVTYSGIRKYTLKAWQDFNSAARNASTGMANSGTIISILLKHHVSQKDGYLDDLEIASECADHLLAGVDTTANTLMFLLWALSLVKNKKYQDKLVEELRNLSPELIQENGVPSVRAADKLVYVNAVIKEALRLYAPLPATQPRSSPLDSTIDGYMIPARTIVGMAPYSLHRNHQVFDEPLKFNPDRWLAADATVDEMNRWFWPFSSGSRMCIGNHLVMTEMTTLLAAIYRQYKTSVTPGLENFTPVVTSRYELFFDEKMLHLKARPSLVNILSALAKIKNRSTNVGSSLQRMICDPSYP